MWLCAILCRHFRAEHPFPGGALLASLRLQPSLERSSACNCAPPARLPRPAHRPAITRRRRYTVRCVCALRLQLFAHRPMTAAGYPGGQWTASTLHYSRGEQIPSSTRPMAAADLLVRAGRHEPTAPTVYHARARMVAKTAPLIIEHCSVYANPTTVEAAERAIHHRPPGQSVLALVRRRCPSCCANIAVHATVPTSGVRAGGHAS